MENIDKGSLGRVLFAVALDPARKFGSMEEQVFALSKEFKKRGSLFLPLYNAPFDPKTARMYEEIGIEVDGINLSKFTFHNLYKLITLIRKKNIDIMHWNFYHPFNLYLWCLTILTPRLKHYMTEHNSRESSIAKPKKKNSRIIRSILCSRYAKVLCVSDFVLDFLRRQGTWSNLIRCTHFVNTNRFAPNSVIRENIRYDLKAANRFIMLVVAHLIHQKGVDVALEALRNLPDSVGMWVVGEGRAKDHLQNLCGRLNLGDRVQFLGHQQRVEPYMQGADCLVCPSIWAEAAGLVILEGLASGLPVIGSTVGGIPEYIEDGRTGFLFKRGDSQELAEKILFLLNNPEERTRMSHQARETAITKYSIEERIEEYLDLYQLSA